MENDFKLSRKVLTDYIDITEFNSDNFKIENHVKNTASEDRYGHVRFATEEEVLEGGKEGLAVSVKSLNQLKDLLVKHEQKVGDYQEAGHVRLSNAVNSQSSVSDGVASTPRAVKEVNDKVLTHEDRRATKSHLGHVKIGDGINVDSDGTISVDEIDIDTSDLASKKEFDEHISLKADGWVHGHVMLSDNINSYDNVSSGKSATPYAVKLVNDSVKELKSDIEDKAKEFVTKEHVFQLNVKTGSSGTAFGSNTRAMGSDSFAGGNHSGVDGNYGFAFGHRVTSSGNGSVVFGSNSQAYTPHSIVAGEQLDTFFQGKPQAVFGSWNQPGTKSLLTVGNGIPGGRNNAFMLNDDGNLFIQGEYKAGGADYAEMFEWEDGNPDNVDRVALAVTWGEGESIKLANAGDEVIGIVSATASVVGDNPMDWDRRFLTDQFGRLLTKTYKEVDEDGIEKEFEWFVENPEYNSEEEYIPRDERPEWDAIGLMGKLYWIDDGSLEVGDYATVGKDGVATKGTKENGYRVMKRISKSVDGVSGVVKVFFR